MPWLVCCCCCGFVRMRLLYACFVIYIYISRNGFIAILLHAFAYSVYSYRHRDESIRRTIHSRASTFMFDLPVCLIVDTAKCRNGQKYARRRRRKTTKDVCVHFRHQFNDIIIEWEVRTHTVAHIIHYANCDCHQIFGFRSSHLRRSHSSLSTNQVILIVPLPTLVEQQKNTQS